MIQQLKQKPLTNFTSFAMDLRLPYNPHVQKALNELNSSPHIDVHTYASLLYVCASSNALSQGRQVHRHIMTHGLGAHTSLGFLILEMYGKCGAVEDAAAWFAEMPCRAVCAWNYMMGLNLRHGRSLDAMHLFDQMLQEGTLADMVTFISIVSACTSLSLLVEGKQMNARLLGSGYEDHIVVLTAFINFYSKCRDPNHALQLFDVMPRRGTITWNALISGYKQNKQCKEVFQLFDQMHIEGVLPSRATFACTLSACATQVSLFEGKRMHVYIKQAGFEFDFVVSNALVRMYSQCGSLEDAQALFDELSGRSVVAAKAMIAAYAHHGCLKDAIKLLNRMLDEGAVVEMITYIQLLDVCGKQGAMALAEGKEMHAFIKRSGYEGSTLIGNTLISMYGKCCSLEDAENVFDKMLDKDVVSWNAIIAAYAQNGQRKKALGIFIHMQQAGIMPNEVTFLCVLDLYTSQADLLDNQWFHVRAQFSGICSDVAVATALVNMHAKTGSLISARSAFDLMLEPNVISWTAMISSYSLHAHDKEALQLYKQMLQQGGLLDMVTFAIAISASTSLGSVNEGKVLHACVKHYLSDIELAVANALVNMYGKCGHLSAALNMFHGLPVRNVETWNIMLGIYAQHGGVREAFFLLEQMQEVGLAPDKVTTVTYLSACSRAGLVGEAFGCLLYMNDDMGVMPTLEHYDCMVDVLGRAGQSHKAQCVIDILPLQPTGLSWMTLLTVCRDSLGMKEAEYSATHVLELNPMLFGFP